jgi:hypothetical protein
MPHRTRDIAVAAAASQRFAGRMLYPSDEPLGRRRSAPGTGVFAPDAALPSTRERGSRSAREPLASGTTPVGRRHVRDDGRHRNTKGGRSRCRRSVAVSTAAAERLSAISSSCTARVRNYWHACSRSFRGIRPTAEATSRARRECSLGLSDEGAIEARRAGRSRGAGESRRRRRCAPRLLPPRCGCGRHRARAGRVARGVSPALRAVRRERARSRTRSQSIRIRAEAFRCRRSSRMTAARTVGAATSRGG